jgi:diguanylate cyclase (GGDEF)-like protein
MDFVKALVVKISKIVLVLSTLTALTAVAMGAVLFFLVQEVSRGANARDDAKSIQAVSSTVAGVLDQISGIMNDNAKWDDAVVNVYDDKQIQWIAEMWGNSTADKNYDAAFVIHETGKTMAAFSGGKALTIDANAFFGNALSKMVSNLPGDNKTFAVTTSLIKTPKGVSAVAVAPVLPYTNAVSVPIAQPRLVVFSKTLTPEILAELGKRLVVKDLKIVPVKPEDAPFVPLSDSAGSIAGYMTWTPDRPGDAAQASIQLPAVVSISAMISCMVLLTGFSGRLSSRLQKSEKKAWGLAYRDVLTALPNRRATLAHLDAKLNSLKPETEQSVSVMLVDLDGFKEVNDTYGHQVGDQLLKGVGAGLNVIVQEYSATLSRLGGDEFAIIVDGENSDQHAQDISNALLQFVLEPFDIEGRIIRVGLSIGIATISKPTTDCAELMREADVAMYIAKERGKNQYCVYKPDFDVQRNSRVQMAAQLAEALSAHRIEVMFQPIVDATSRRITGVEALARWQQSDGQWVRPDIFVGVAEEFGLIDELGKQVLTIACREAATWNDINLSVNISPAQFRNPAFVDTVLAIVDKSGLPRNRLELEVTEGYLIEHQERARPIIEMLRAAGLQVSLDDFGTGYSSIGYLRQYRFDKLKIDRSLISSMIEDSSAGNIIHATTVLARSMNMLVTAEGVEKEEEVNLLRLAGCDTLQGYFFGRPQSAQSISKLVSDQQLISEAA